MPTAISRQPGSDSTPKISQWTGNKSIPDDLRREQMKKLFVITARDFRRARGGAGSSTAVTNVKDGGRVVEWLPPAAMQPQPLDSGYSRIPASTTVRDRRHRPLGDIDFGPERFSAPPDKFLEKFGAETVGPGHKVGMIRNAVDRGISTCRSRAAPCHRIGATWSSHRKRSYTSIRQL